MKNTFTFLFLFTILPFSFVKAQNETTVISPDGFLKMQVFQRPENPNGELFYQINYKNQPAILPSELGLSGWGDKMEIENVQSRTQDTSWKPVYGERAVVRDHFNEKTFVLTKKGVRNKLWLIVRAYNEGIAFRYFYPEDPESGGSYLGITSEKTSFVLPENTFGWFAHNAQAAYQYLPLKNWPGECERPLTLKLSNGLYVSLAEAEMVNYSRTKFMIRPNEENIIRCSMYGRVDEVAPFGTPWRVVMVADKPANLLANNDLILNLNPPCEIKNTDWIQPGTIIRTVSLTTSGAQKVVDFAAKRNIRYVHFDAGWYGAETSINSNPTKCDVDPKRSKINDLNITEVVQYAKSKGVGIWVYVNQRALANYLDEILPLYQSWGIAGIKFGFVQVGSHRWTTWLHEAVKKCAQYNLMVDIHDEYRPTGFSRTYPNLLTQEGIRGNEEFTDANINTTHPFTRFIAGAGDYTICYFHRKELKPDLERSINARSLQNTSGHQLALSVIFYSPLQFLYWYDTPEDVQDEPELPFFDHLPTTWDDTKVLDGQIGEYISIARKKGNDGYVGCITNNDARKMNFSFDFLDPGKNYEMILYTDGGEKIKTRTHVKIETKKVKKETKLNLDFLPRGGCAMVIKEIK